MSGPELRFLQISDLHLGGRVAPSCFRLSADQTHQRTEELRQTLPALLKRAEAFRPDAVLIPGDLFDRECVPNDLVNLAADVFAALPPVFIAPGNHDYHSPGGPYSAQERTRRGLRPWPENVILFDRPEFTTRYLPGRADVGITGHAFQANQPVTEHRLATRLPRDPAPLSVLLLHGSRTQFALEEAQKITFPFTASELLHQGFSYTALGHYHSFSQIVDSNGGVRAAYAGRPFNAEFSTDNLGALGGTITPDGARSLERFSLDPRRVLEVSVFCDNAGSPEELAALAEKAWHNSGATTQDLVLYRFHGTHRPGFTPRVPIPADRHFASAVAFHDLRPGYDLPSLLEAAERPAASAESLFARTLAGELERAASDGEREILRDALDYGMRALRGLPVVPASGENEG